MEGEGLQTVLVSTVFIEPDLSDDWSDFIDVGMKAK